MGPTVADVAELADEIPARLAEDAVEGRLAPSVQHHLDERSDIPLRDGLPAKHGVVDELEDRIAADLFGCDSRLNLTLDKWSQALAD